MIRLERVSYSYPEQRRPVLERFDLEIQDGEMFLVAGPSGVGKSSLLRSLNGLVPHFHGGVLGGRIRVDGRDPIALGPRGMSDLVGFVGQDPEAHFVARVVEDELAFVMENHGVAPAVMRQRIEEVLERLLIAPLRHREIDTLSGGERQRVAIASVLTLEPAVLVLDEPTSQLDPQAAEEVLQTLRRLNEEFGMTIVVSEHRLERMVPYVDRVLLLAPDAPPRLGTPTEVLVGTPFAPPLLRLGQALGWKPLPLTLEQARRHPGLPGLRDSLSSASVQVPLDPPFNKGERPLPPSIIARDVWLRYDNGQEALAGAGLEVASGELLALMGHNGAGKSTLLKVLVGLLHPTRGTVSLRSGRGAVSLDPHRERLEEVTRTVALVPQNPSRLLFHETVEEEFAFTLRTHGTSVERLDLLRAELGITALGRAHPRDLSTGERQRVALAVVLAAGPEILLLDEPTRGLDPPRKLRLARWLCDFTEGGGTVVLTTHDVELVATCADRVVILEQGKVVASGSPAEILTDSEVFGSQISRLLRDPRFQTVEGVLSHLGAINAGRET